MVCRLCATTAGSLPSVSTSSQSWLMTRILPVGGSELAGDDGTTKSAISRYTCGVETLRKWSVGVATRCDEVIFLRLAGGIGNGSRCPTVRRQPSGASACPDLGAPSMLGPKATVEGSVVAAVFTPLASAPSTRRSTPTAPALSSGSLPLPHFGDCTHDGQPSRALARLDRRRRRLPPRRDLPEAAVGESRAAGIAVVDEYRRQAADRTDRRRHPADVAAVAAGDQRQQADRRVLGGMQRPRVSAAVRSPLSCNASGVIVHITAMVSRVRVGMSSSTKSITSPFSSRRRYPITVLLTDTGTSPMVTGP